MNVGEMQTKRSRWAEEEPSRNFQDLYHLLYDDDWLRTAQTHVRQNAGSRTAGCDGVTMTDFEEDLEGKPKRLREAITESRVEPRPNGPGSAPYDPGTHLGSGR